MNLKKNRKKIVHLNKSLRSIEVLDVSLVILSR